MSEFEPISIPCFKAYDIRGKLGAELNVDVVYRIGRAFGEFLKPEQVEKKFIVRGRIWI